MGKIHIENAKISSNEAYGLYHGTTQLAYMSQSAFTVTGSLNISGSVGMGSDLFKIGNNYIYASSSGQIGIGTANPTALLEISGSANRDYLIIRSGSLKGMTINSEGVLILGTFTDSNAPTAHSGGLYYNSDSNAFFLGIN